MPHVIESAPTGRAKCRGCGAKIDAGALRFGEALPNPFGEGDTTHWFHLDCGAFKRPEPFLEALGAREEPLDGKEGLEAAARAGIDHPRLVRVDGAERSPTGRAECRHCREAIPKDAWRVRLVFWEEGRFNAAGFVHVRCAPAYFETGDLLPRVRRFAPALTDEDARAIEAELPGK
ncbi:MAG: hypothetical protein U0599_24920 [Vicinamibacteria bacterium]